jgi:hypothetical protein
VHRRKPGDLLHADRESQSVIDEAKSAMGSLAFAAPVTEAAIWSSGRGFASTMRRLGAPSSDAKLLRFIDNGGIDVMPIRYLLRIKVREWGSSRILREST